MSLSVEDRLEIHELISLYGHIIDERQFSRLGDVFTDDAVFDLTGYGGDCHYGLAAITRLMRESDEHPLAHHATNVVIGDSTKRRASVGGEKIALEDVPSESISGGEHGGSNPREIKVISKAIGVGYKGRVGSVTYRDSFVLQNGGWRIKLRVCELRRSSGVPEPS